jgi:hypothetical protein
VDTPGRARASRARKGGVRRDRDEGHVELVPDFDLVVLAAPRAALRSKTVRFSGSRTSRARAVQGSRHLAAEAAGLRIQEALIGFRTVASKNAGDGACARGIARRASA